MELPDQPWIVMPRVRRGNLFDPVVRHSPLTPRKVGMPLSALTPAPVRMKTLSLGETESTDQVYLRPVRNPCCRVLRSNRACKSVSEHIFRPHVSQSLPGLLSGKTQCVFPAQFRCRPLPVESCRREWQSRVAVDEGECRSVRLKGSNTRRFGLVMSDSRHQYGR